MSPKRPWLPKHDAYVRRHTHMTATEIAAEIGHHSNTVSRHARSLGVKLKCGKPVPYSKHAKRAVVARTWHFAGLYDWARARNRSLSA